MSDVHRRLEGNHSSECPSRVELLPLTCFPLNCFPDFSPLGPCPLFGALFLAWSPSAARPFLVDCPSGRPSKRRTFDFKARERRRVDGKWRRLRTVRWALACLPMRSPSSSFWRYKGTEKISYHKTFRPKNAAKIENYFGQTSVLTPYLPSDEQCSI